MEAVGGFEIEGLLGRGGMAAVYRARDADGRVVALKLLHPDLVKDEAARARARREAAALSRVVSPHVVRIVALGDDAKAGPWTATELSPAPRLSEVLAGATAGIEPRRAGLLVAQLSSGLAELHDVGVLHRDLKPDNVFVETRDGRDHAVLFDLSTGALIGASHLTPPGTVMGSPAYVSPERIHGREGDPRSDLWAAGVLLYECLTGRQPFRGDDLRTLLDAILGDAPTPLSAYVVDVPPALVAIVARALAKEPEARFNDARQMSGALYAAIE